MRVYLDTNIFIYLESEKYSYQSFLVVPNATYFFSDIHIDELINGITNNPGLKDVRLQSIELLCGSNYLAPDLGPANGEYKGSSLKTPQEAFDFSMRFKHMHDELLSWTKAISVNRDTLINELKLNKLEVGNIPPSDIICIIDRNLKAVLGYGVDVYLEKSVATTGRSAFLALFNLLDFICYWHDVSNVARLYDSSHAYFAHYCNVLVTNDKRMRIKTEAVYSYYGIRTKVLTADDFITAYSI